MEQAAQPARHRQRYVHALAPSRGQGFAPLRRPYACLPDVVGRQDDHDQGGNGDQTELHGRAIGQRAALVLAVHGHGNASVAHAVSDGGGRDGAAERASGH